jgi:hypothetical protein
MRSAVALLHVRRLPSNLLQRGRAVEEAMFVVRSSRRRGLALTAFEVDPDAAEREQKRIEKMGGGAAAAAVGAGEGGGGGASALMCGGPAGKGSALDF